MGLPLSARKRLQIVGLYKQGFSMREVAMTVGVSLEGVRKVLRADAPEIIRKPYQGMRLSPEERLAIHGPDRGT